ncbi:MAG: branched-chain amino acid ABC transporter permease [Acidimicrobiales bacterium]
MGANVLTSWMPAQVRSNLTLLFLVGLGIPTAIFLALQLGNNPALFFQTLMKSLGLGSVYAIIALGFVLIFKATQTINFAQGGMAAAGALFVSFAVADENIPFTTIHNPLIDINPTWLGWGLSVLVALSFAALMGLIIERVVLRPMIGEPLFSVAVITLGLEIVLRVFNADATRVDIRQVNAPWGAGGFDVGGALINWAYIAAMITAGAAFVAVFFFYRSRMGISMRAVAYDQEAAMAQGINVGRVFAIAWGAGAVLAAIGGLFATGPPVGYSGGVDETTANIAFRALPAVILGGLDSATGALLGGLTIGLIEIFAGQYAAGEVGLLGAGYPLIIPYVVMMIGLVIRPYGMFGTPEIRRV